MKKLPEGVQEDIFRSVVLFRDKKNHPTLKFHKLSGRMKKYWAILAIVVVIILFVFLWRNRGAAPALLPPRDGELVEGELGLNLPRDFSISVYAHDLPGARVIAFDDFNNMWVSRPSEGAVSMIEVATGKINQIFRDLNKPHGIAIRNNTIYIAEENQIRRIALYSDDRGQVIAELPEGGRHSTRTPIHRVDVRCVY